jgi:hypothetical protein
LVVFAPVIEELFFRGMLFSRWSIKWDTPEAIFASSVLFAKFHADFYGKFLFGYILCLLYMKTRSLYLPMLAHFVNNILAFLLDLHLYRNTSIRTEQDLLFFFEKNWKLPLFCLAISAVWFLYFILKNRHYHKSSAPYMLFYPVSSIKKPSQSTSAPSAKVSNSNDPLRYLQNLNAPEDSSLEKKSSVEDTEKDLPVIEEVSEEPPPFFLPPQSFEKQNEASQEGSRFDFKAES